MITRKDILQTAEKMVNGDRQDDYGTPENNFSRIADLWRAYLGSKPAASINAVDVAAMLALLKIARIASGHGKSDNWIDLAGYAACGGELQTATPPSEEDPEATETESWLKQALDTSIESLSSILKDSVMRAFEAEGHNV